MDNISHRAPAQCDRVALYGTKQGDTRTRTYPLRGGVEVPLRFEDKGVEWVLLCLTTPQAGEDIDAAILREIRETEDIIADLLAEDAA